ncbi:transposase [Candidatus Desantisbacteria bacterium]|nr:transposase [Candidatus Desantisbacteria bacterium]
MMQENKQIQKHPIRKNQRLQNYDYSQNGYYFVTICIHDKKEWFGKIENEKTVLNEYGEIVFKCWIDLPEHYKNIKLDEFVIMPNHVHGIVVIDNVGNGLVRNGLKPFPTNNHGLSEIIRGFKTFSSRRINEKISDDIKFQWQKSFYDHVVRDEKSLHDIRKYIQENPLKWGLDDVGNETVWYGTV